MTKTADFLVELGTEELPPKALRRLRDAFAASFSAGLDAQRLAHGDIQSFASPRRLALLAADLAGGQAQREVKQKGPPVNVAFDSDGNATRAALAFAKKCGVEIDDLQRERTDAGEWLVHTATEEGRSAAELLPEIVQTALNELPIPRRMRWGSGDSEFVRPVHWLVMLHGNAVVEGEVMGITAGNRSRGHRFHAPGEIEIASPGEYANTLCTVGKVLAEFDARKEKIVAGVKKAAADGGGFPIGTDALYDEVTALTEWPVPLTGSFDPGFLELPDEVIVETLASHQRYFPLRDDSGKLLPAFVTVANLESTEPDSVRDGNERVIRPRLADAAFFWKTDLLTPLAGKRERLAKVVYQQGLGSLQDKSDRVAALADVIADQTAADKVQVKRAAELCKCDLVTGMVGEFPGLQGTMGGYYAAHDGENPHVCAAIREHYMPRFAGDDLPESTAGQTLAMADKLDTIAGAFALGKKPSGNRDPFGLRRAALGVIRLIIEKEIDVDIVNTVAEAVRLQPVDDLESVRVEADIYDFIVDRLRNYVADKDDAQQADLFAAVRSQRPVSLIDFVARLEAVTTFLQLDAAESLAAANKRIGNILQKAQIGQTSINPALLSEEAELQLHDVLTQAQSDVTPLIEQRAYTDAMHRLAELRQPVDTFFDDVMVMADDEAIRNNRIALLTELRALFLGIADISRLTPAQD